MLDANTARTAEHGFKLTTIALSMLTLFAGHAGAQEKPVATPVPATAPSPATKSGDASAANAANATQAAAARPASPAKPVVETIVVTGQRANLRKALKAQEEADHVVSVLSSDDIGQLPDTNAAEALQRLPGVSVERDQGEGRYVSVRGLGADFNTVTINGALVPAPEGGRRGVMLDVLPAGLIRSLEVSKTLTPDRDANSVGGTIEVKTLSAFDLPGRFLSVEGIAGRDRNTEQTSPKFGALWADRFLDGKLGIAAGLSTEKRKFGSDNVETGGAWKGDKLGEFERRDYRITRERDALALNLDYRPAAGATYYLRGFASRFSDDEVRNAQVIEFADEQAPGALGDAKVKRELKAREETQKIESFVFGGEHNIAAWKTAFGLGASTAREDTPESISGAAFKGNSTFRNVGFTDSRRPALLGPDSLYDAASYKLDEIELEANSAKDREHHVRFDMLRRFASDAFDVDFKFGAKLSRRKKTNDTEVFVIDGGDVSGSSSLTSFAGGQVNYALGPFGPGIDPALVFGRIAGLGRAAFRDDEGSRVDDYTMKENIDAGYAMATLSRSPWQLLAGVRYERTRFEAEGTGLNDGDFERISAQRSRTHWLPSVHMRHDLDRSTSIRAAWTNSVVRPSFGQLAPGFVIDGDEASFGNPNLTPLKSANFDLGIERQLGTDGAVSAYLFNKDIKNFIYQTDLAGTSGYAGFDEAITFVNGDKARVRGLELSYSQALSWLPSPWNGLVLGANATFVNSDATIGRFDADAGRMLTRKISLPSQSDRVFNVTVGYEAGPLSMRLALNQKSPYLLEVGDVLDAASDLTVDTQKQVDFQLRYQVNKRVQLSFEGLNLNNEKYYVYQGDAQRNAQYEQYGRTYKIGVKVNLF